MPERKKTAPMEADATVVQIPVAVHVECPACGEEIRTPYEEFVAAHGDPPDWESLECPHCGQAIRLDRVEWD